LSALKTTGLGANSDKVGIRSLIHFSRNGESGETRPPNAPRAGALAAGYPEGGTTGRPRPPVFCTNEQASVPALMRAPCAQPVAGSAQELHIRRLRANLDTSGRFLFDGCLDRVFGGFLLARLRDFFHKRSFQLRKKRQI
jgi:hypothetical protein